MLAALGMVYFMYAGLAVGDLAGEATAVWRHAARVGISAAHASDYPVLSGATPNDLEEPEIVRATVETVAESTVDGILAPMFFAAVGGAPGLWAYKAINTLDSMVGHREAPYTRFGWAAARLDDVANFIPARLGLFLFGVGTWIVGGEIRSRCWRIGWRDGGKHPSPNSGISEAAMAGALGGPARRHQYVRWCETVRPYLGDPVHPLEIACIPQAIRIMYATSAAGLALCVVARWVVS